MIIWILRLLECLEILSSPKIGKLNCIWYSVVCPNISLVSRCVDQELSPFLLSRDIRVRSEEQELKISPVSLSSSTAERRAIFSGFQDNFVQEEYVPHLIVLSTRNNYLLP